MYEWMLSRGLEGELLAGSNVYRGLEAFLARAARSRPDSIEVNDLLWKFHERNGNHAAAAKILYQLASKPRYLSENSPKNCSKGLNTMLKNNFTLTIQGTHPLKTKSGLLGSCYYVHEE